MKDAACLPVELIVAMVFGGITRAAWAVAVAKRGGGRYRRVSFVLFDDHVPRARRKILRR
jgi:hypothetical protein